MFGINRFLRDVRLVASDQFWKFFLRLHTFSGVTIDTALAGVKKVFKSLQNDATWHRFPTSRRQLMNLIKRIHSFWDKFVFG